MSHKKSKTSLIYRSIEAHKESGKPLELKSKGNKRVSFDNLDIDSIRPKKKKVDYASVKIKTGLYMKIKEAAENQGIRQPGKFISLILESYLKQLNELA